MQTIRINNLSHPELKPILARNCDTFFCRLRGFTFRRRLRPDEALLFVQPRENRVDAAIHMITVGTDLAVFWINNGGVVVDLCLARRWHPYYAPRRPARYTLEMAPDRIDAFQIGDEVAIEKVGMD
jgi:uncharacterized membrane protein (UPF0127 family)